MCDIVKDANGDTFPHQHWNNHITFFLPELPDKEDWLELKRYFPGKKLEARISNDKALYSLVPKLIN